MKYQNYFLLLASFVLFLTSFDTRAQVNANQNTTSVIAGENPFFDAATNFDMSVDPSSSGKGLYFPRTDLTAWTFNTGLLDGITFPTAFDGMIVYNVGTGTTLSGEGQVVNVEPGFYYFYNPTGDIDVSSGMWLSLKGLSGPTGPTGAEGDQGPIGPPGPTGQMGLPGLQGNTGAIGSQGIHGNTGAVGPQGAQGNTGAVGAQGIQGNTGNAGAQGVQGNTGAVGPLGAQGNTGAIGQIGPQGNTGDIGPQGAQGNTGAKGDTGSTGAVGQQGAQGATGTIGAQGIQGPQGNTGAIGIQGIQGNTGAQGAVGAQGSTGAIGATGPLVAGTTGQTLRYDGSTWVANSVLFNNGTNIGIGNSLPSALLHITSPNLSSNQATFRLSPIGNDGSSISRFSLIDLWATFDNFPSDQGPRRTASIKASYNGGVWGSEYLSFHVGGASDAANLPDEKMRIVAAGNVGIGTIYPSERLHVNAGNLKISGSTNTNAETGGMLIYDNTTGLGGGNAKKTERMTRVVVNNATDYIIYEDFAVRLSVRRSGHYHYIRLSPKTGYTGWWRYTNAINQGGGVNCGTVGSWYTMSSAWGFYFDDYWEEASETGVILQINKRGDFNAPTYVVKVQRQSLDANSHVTAIVEAYYP